MEINWLRWDRRRQLYDCKTTQNLWRRFGS